MKAFKLKPHELKALISEIGGCFATDKITVEGMKVGYMYREHSDVGSDSGWRFFSGTESQAYVDNPDNTSFFSVNTIANYDPTIIPFLDKPIGSEFERIEGTKEFKEI